MYVPGDYFRGGETNASNRRYILLQDYMHLLVHLDQRQSAYANPHNRPNSYKKLPVQNSFEEWWDSDEEQEEQSEDSEDEGDTTAAHHSDLFDGSRKRPASCHWSPNPQYQEIIRQYSKRPKIHRTKLQRPQDAPLDVLPMSSPQITSLRQKMYTYMKYHRKNINTGLAIMFEDALTYDPAVVSISGYETKAPVYGGIRSPHGRWWEYYWGFIGEEELYEMETFENNETNTPLPMHQSFAESKLQNAMLLGMPLWGPSRFDDQLLKMMYHSRATVPSHKPAHQALDGKFNCNETYKHLSSNKKNVNFVLYHRYILQTLFHISFSRRDWDTAYKLYGALTQSRKSNRLNSWPMGMEVLRNLNYRKWVNELNNIKPVGDTKPVNSNELDIIFPNEDSIYISSNTLHYLSELKSPLLLPLILDHYIRNHTTLIQRIEKLVVSPSNLLNKIDKLFRHFARTERGKFILHFNGPETTFLLPHTSKRAMEDEIYENETNVDIGNLNVNENNGRPNYEFRKPRTMKKVTCFLWDYHVHYRTGNKYKLSPSVISQVNYLLINGKFDQAREVAEFGQKNKVPTAEADMLLIEINIGDILSKLSEIMIVAESSSAPFNDDVKIQSLLKSIDGLNNDILDIWASWKDQFGYIENEDEHEQANKNIGQELNEENGENDIKTAETKVKKQRSEVGMENWGYVQEIILRLGVWIEFVKRGGKVGLGVDVFGDDWKPNDDYVDSEEELMVSDDGFENENPTELDSNDEINSEIGGDTDIEQDAEQFSHDELDSIDDPNSDTEETNKGNDSDAYVVKNADNYDVESDEDDMGIIPDDFNEDDPEFQREMQQLMGYDTQEQAEAYEGHKTPALSNAEELQSDNDSFVDEFNSDNSDYQREMERYQQYSQSQPSQSQVIQPLGDDGISERDTSSLDELSD